jgi:hypothetical protein
MRKERVKGTSGSIHLDFVYFCPFLGFAPYIPTSFASLSIRVPSRLFFPNSLFLAFSLLRQSTISRVVVANNNYTTLEPSILSLGFFGDVFRLNVG